MQSTSLPPSNVRAVTFNQKRVARRLANYAYSISCAIKWRNRAFLAFGHADKEGEMRARLNMRESALRAAFWRNLIVTE